MSEKAKTIEIGYYADLLVRRRWYIIPSLGLSLIIGIYFAIVLPKVYRSTTLIMVEPQRVPDQYVTSIMKEDIKSRISNISQQITSRTSIERVIKKFNLFSEKKYRSLYMEDKVKTMRDNIDIEVSAVHRGPNTFTISYKGPEPEMVVKVVNGLARTFIDEILRFRESQATGTSAFLESQLHSIRNRLEEVEKKLGNYRKSHMGELPEQLNANLRMLENLQIQLNARQKSLQDAKKRLILLDNRIEANKKLQTVVSKSIDNAETNKDNSINISELKIKLAKLKTTYTDDHPDVIILKGKIKEVEENLDKEGSEIKLANNKSYLQSFAENKEIDYIQQRHEILIEIENLNIEIIKIKKEKGGYERRIESTPKREEELFALKRDYKNIQNSYNSLLKRQLEAEISVSMERKQKGEQFRIVDQAQLPRKPISPNMMNLFIFSIAAGLGVGIGMVFLLDYFDFSIKQRENFESETGIAILGSIPKINNLKNVLIRRANQIATTLSMIVIVSLLMGFALIAVKGESYTLKMIEKISGLQVTEFILTIYKFH